MKFEWFYFVYLMGLKDGLSSGMSLGNEKILKIVEVERNKALDMIDNADDFWTHIIGQFKDQCRDKAVEAIKALEREETIQCAAVCYKWRAEKESGCNPFSGNVVSIQRNKGGFITSITLKNGTVIDFRDEEGLPCG